MRWCFTAGLGYYKDPPDPDPEPPPPVFTMPSLGASFMGGDFMGPTGGLGKTMNHQTLHFADIIAGAWRRAR